MFILAIIVSVIIGYLRRGQLKNLEFLSIKLWYLLSLAFLIQIIAIRVSFLTDYIFYILHISSYVIIMYICWVNFQYVSVKVMAIGNLCNALVIAFNQGKMPVKVPDIVDNPIFDRGHMLLTSSTKLEYLADIIFIRIPSFKIYMLSIGDIFLIVGVFLLIQRGMIIKSTQSRQN